MKGDLTTIMISKQTRDLLKEFGKKGETYDDIINKLMEAAVEHGAERS